MSIAAAALQRERPAPRTARGLSGLHSALSGGMRPQPAGAPGGALAAATAPACATRSAPGRAGVPTAARCAAGSWAACRAARAATAAARAALHRASGAAPPPLRRLQRTRLTPRASASDALCDVDWSLDGVQRSWRDRFSMLARSACAETSPECLVRQDLEGANACAECTLSCCNWASAHAAWARNSRANAGTVEALLSAALQREPANADLLASYAVYLWEHGDAEAASTLFDAAAALEPGNLDVLASRAYFAMVTKHTVAHV